MSVARSTYHVRVRRGDSRTTEALHVVGGVTWMEDGREAPSSAREPLTYFRSACKPFQALPLVERGHAARFGFGAAELAVMCASHNGAANHVEVVRGILERIGLEDTALLCGFHYPEDPESHQRLRTGELPHSPLYNNCSGKHAGMLALAVAEGWPVEEYVAFDHPVQRAVLGAVAEMCGVDAGAMPLSVDGCSAANPALPLSAMARGFARFALAAENGAEPRERALATLRSAMAERPELVAGEGRLCTDVMRATRGAVVTKTGAEGLQCAAIAALRAGVAIKVQDGARRALGPALVALLDDLGGLDTGARSALLSWRQQVLHNHRGTAVGELTVERAAAAPFESEAAATPAPAIAGTGGRSA